MATYYVRKSGSNGNPGTSPGAAWATLGKALGATGIASGDTVYVGAGVYRETISVGMVSAVAQTFIVGDVDGSHTGDPGEVQVTAYTTDDKTAPAAVPVLSLAGRDFLTFSNILFIGGNTSPSLINPSGDAFNITFRECAFIAYFNANVVSILMAFTTGLPMHWLFDRCRFFMASGQVTLPTAAADYDADIVFRNCVIDASGIALDIGASGALAGKGGGVLVINCTIRGAGPPIRTNSANISTTIPCKVENSVLLAPASAVALNANTLGQIVEQFNLIYASTPGRTNVAVGAGSVSDGSVALLMEIGQDFIVGKKPRPRFAPAAGSRWLGLGSSASAQTVDANNAPRPAGGASALKAPGAYERGNTWGRETITVHAGTNAISIIGPGYYDIVLPVDAALTTVSCYARYDATYAGTKPQLQVLDGAECGVANATASFGVGSSDADPGANAWAKLKLQFTPTAKGYVTIRILSSDTNGGGKAIADDLVAA